MAALETISGTVTHTNTTGFRVAERDGWLNISQYAAPRPTLPAVGQKVTIGVDGSGFVRSVAVLEPGAAPSPSAPGSAAAPTTRETTITRLACLKAAAEFLAPRTDAKSPDVLGVTAAFEAWVTR